MPKVDLSKYSYLAAEPHHYSYQSTTWRNNISQKLKHPKTGRKWDNPGSGFSGIRMSCAVRLSVALYRAGVRFQPTTQYYWTRPSGARYPSQADQYPDLLVGGEEIKKASDIIGRRGVIYFSIGHVTLWNGASCHFGGNDAFWTSGKVIFWPMAP